MVVEYWLTSEASFTLARHACIFSVHKKNHVSSILLKNVSKQIITDGILIMIKVRFSLHIHVFSNSFNCHGTTKTIRFLLQLNKEKAFLLKPGSAKSAEMLLNVTSSPGR